MAKQRLRKNRSPRAPAIQRLLERAYELKRRLDRSPRLTRFALAKDLGFDPSRISQILNLMNLSAEIQAYIRNLPPTKRHNPIGDRHWMRLARIKNHDLQLQEFQRSKNRAKATTLSSVSAP